MLVTEEDKPERGAHGAPHAPGDILLRRYLVRDLLWCGGCDLPLFAVLVPPGARYYGCANRRCVRRLLPAGIVEQRVWSGFVAINQLLAVGVPRDRRHEVLRQLLKRVVVGRSSVDFTFEWRE